jgi:ankyrin repeat protein
MILRAPGHDEPPVAVKLLIAKGADVNAKDVKGGTPLDSTILYDQAQIAELLRKHGGKTGAELKVPARSGW